MNAKNAKKTSLYLSSSLLALLIIFAVNFGWLNSLIAKDLPKIGASAPPIQIDNSIKALNNALVAVSEAVNPTVVSITVVSESNAANMNYRGFEFFGFPFGSPFDEGDGGSDRSSEKEKPKKEGSGSGVVISENGYIVTNNHVVENAIENGIKVTLWNKKVYPAKLIGTDPLTDLAVIKIDADGLATAHFGDADKLKPGQIVIAVGNPLGLSHTVTQGIISALGRDAIDMSMRRKDARSFENYIQTDAAINPGNSGGGLFDLNGSLIGINTAIATQTGGFMGYGFAIPIDIVKTTAEDLIAEGKVNRGYIGASVRDIDDVEAKHYGLDKVEGVWVSEVNKNSPAEKAGVNPEDIILEVNGKAVKTVPELRSAISRYRAGDEVMLTIWREKKKISKKVKLEALEADDFASNSASENKPSDKESESNDKVVFEKMGFTVEALTKEQKNKFDVKNGVIVKDVVSYSPANQRGLRRGMVITKIDRNDVKTTGQLKKVIESKKSGETVLLNIMISNSNLMLVLEIP